MYCPNCGKEIKEGSKFCKYCGAKVVKETEIDTKGKEAQQEGKKPKKKPLSKAGKILIGVAIILWAIIIPTLICGGCEEEEESTKPKTRMEELREVWDKSIEQKKEIQRQEADKGLSRLGEREKQIYLEFKEAMDKAEQEARRIYPPLCHEHLKVGKRYWLFEETPLMPELNPADPLTALKKIKRIPKGGSIKIIKIVHKSGAPWYYVKAKTHTGLFFGYGWINSIALMDQFYQSERERLAKEYILEIVQKYKLTQEDVDEIFPEGTQKE